MMNEWHAYDGVLRSSSVLACGTQWMLVRAGQPCLSLMLDTPRAQPCLGVISINTVSVGPLIFSSGVIENLAINLNSAVRMTF
jgi:hypothetical protein